MIPLHFALPVRMPLAVPGAASVNAKPPLGSRVDALSFQVASMAEAQSKQFAAMQQAQLQFQSQFVDILTKVIPGIAQLTSSTPDQIVAVAKARAEKAEADLAALQRQLQEASEERAASAEARNNAASPNNDSGNGTRASPSPEPGSSLDASEVPELLAGGAEDESSDAAISEQLDDALQQLDALLKASSLNDLCAEYIFECSGLVGTEPGSPERSTAIQNAISTASPKLQAIVSKRTEHGARTKQANRLFSRLLQCVNGSVEITQKGTAGLRSNGQLSPPSPHEQRFLLDQYTPLMQALFPPGKFALDKATLTKGSYLDDPAASAILAAPSRGGQ
jgi:flavin-binding protein dodecin